MYDWDPAKAEANLIKHGVLMNAVERFDWRTAVVRFDEAHSASENRYIAMGLIDGRLHVMSWTPRGAAIRVIGLRKANKREMERYETQT